MINTDDDPFGEYVYNGIHYRPLYGFSNQHIINYVSMDGISRSYFIERLEMGKAKGTFLPSKSCHIMTRIYNNGWSALPLNKLIALCWFHSSHNWKKEEIKLSEEGTVLGWKNFNVPLRKMIDKTVHIKRYVTKFNTIDLYDYGKIIINDMTVPGAFSMGRRWCTIPGENIFELGELISTILNLKIPKNPLMRNCIVYKDSNPDNLNPNNIIISNEKYTKHIPKRHKRILNLFENDIRFEKVPEILNLSSSTVWKYAYEIIQQHNVPVDVIHWILQPHLSQLNDILPDINYTLTQIQNINGFDDNLFAPIRILKLTIKQDKWDELKKTFNGS